MSDNRNMILAIVLSAIVLLGWSFLSDRFLPTATEPTTKIVEGIPKDAIVQEAAEWGADLIVMGSHGYGRFRRMVLGSVAGAVVAGAPCSVQVVRAKHLLHETAEADEVAGAIRNPR